MPTARRSFFPVQDWPVESVALKWPEGVRTMEEMVVWEKVMVEYRVRRSERAEARNWTCE